MGLAIRWRTTRGSERCSDISSNAPTIVLHDPQIKLGEGFSLFRC